jgi:hypothetical protein
VVIDFYHRVAGIFGSMGLVPYLFLVVTIFLVTTAGAVGVVVWLPADHFNRPPGEDSMARRHPILRWTLLILKNLLGAVILPLGVVMALPLVPGPGLVFILVGLSLLDFPGKRRLERRLLLTPTVNRFLNRVRHRFGRPALILER